MSTLGRYRAKRDFAATPEPAGEPTDSKPEERLRFVVQEHHARRLHWDFRLERDGVLVSWAVPRGIPDDPKRNHLAVHVEDHPMEYIDFAGEIPRGSYGAGRVLVWDSGTYETHKWHIPSPGPHGQPSSHGARKGEVMVTLHGRRVRGRYVLFQTDGQNWMIHRMDPPADPHREEMPESVTPMLSRLTTKLPRPDDGWAYEFKWDGIRAVIFSRPHSLRVVTRNQEDVTARYPELRRLADALGRNEVVLDGEIVALGPDGVPRFEELQQRIGLRTESDVRRKMKDVPVYFMAFDLLYCNGENLMGEPYLERRRRLAELGLNGPSWQTPDYQVGDGEAMLEASRRAGLEGLIAKRVDSRYEEGRRPATWLKVKNHLRQDLVIGGWEEGKGRREDVFGALLVGYYEGDRLHYAGQVGTGFTDATLDDVMARIRPMERHDSPFDVGRPPAGSHFVEPRLVGDFEFTEWTRAGVVRAGVFKGLRPRRDPRTVGRERPS